jgi:hypothetical protein
MSIETRCQEEDVALVAKDEAVTVQGRFSIASLR